ncbi:MAG: LysR family transcriptional regulator [Rhodospirillaceae bacterium]|nr:LysR family transcriptional regulator [Rhodospirillaceae bacterium]
MHHTWLRSFHAVAHEGGFTKGAQYLGVGQPTVTAQVRSLEEAFDVELFLRIGKATKLTEAGETLFGITRTLFGYQQEAIDLLRNGGQIGVQKLRIGAANPNAIMPMVKRLKDRLPNVDFSLTIERREEILRQLIDFEIDVAAIGRPPTDPRFETAFHRRLRVDVVVASDHAWADRECVTMAELNGQPMILREAESTTRQAFETAARRAGIDFRTEMEINNREAIREAVVLGLGISVGAETEFGSHRQLRWLSVSDAEMYIELNLTCLAQRRSRPGIRDFFAIASDFQLD